MKTFMQLKFVVAFVMVAAIVGCAKEQSSFSVSDVKDEAKITGLITYDAGVELNGDEYQRLVKSAANVDVVVSLSDIYFMLLSAMKKNNTPQISSEAGMIGIGWASSG